MQSKQGVLQEFKGAWKKHHFISSFHSLRVLQKYLTLNSCSLSVVDGVVTVTPDTFECTNAANLTMRGCSNLLPDSATSNVQGTTASGNRKKQEVGGGPPSGPTGAGGSGTTPALVDVENLFLSFYMSMDARDRMSIGHQFKDTIKSCSFRGKDCASSEYVPFTIDLMLKKCHFHRHFLSSSSSSYGNCFTFNSKFAASEYGGYRMATLPGASFGLNLVI